MVVGRPEDLQSLPPCPHPWIDRQGHPSAPGYAEQLVVRALLAWGVPRECRGPAQVAMVDLVRWAVADAQPRASEPSEAAPVVVGVVRHSDGIIIEVTDSLAGSPDHKVLLGLPQPYGLHWLRDGDKRVVGRLVWCGIRVVRVRSPS